MEGIYCLIDIERDQEIGTVTESQVQFLIDNLEEEGLEDQDYYIDEELLAIFTENGCDADLLAILTEALEGRGDIDIRYEAI